MRIITGKFKGANLYSVQGNTTRPTTDYNRELIFSVYSEYAGKRVLDLFAGTGAFGLEALSRGAIWVDFVEFSNRAIAVLLKNVEKLKCGESCHLHRRKAEAFINSHPEPYDIIFLDPPYAKNLVNPIISAIYANNLLMPNGIIIAEHSPKEIISPEFSQAILKQKSSKITAFSIFKQYISSS